MNVIRASGYPAASRAVQDWAAALRMWRLWTVLGMEDLSDRYRRTAFGVSWVVTSFALFVYVKVMIFGQIANVPFREFALFVTLGFGLWTYINSVVLDCCIAYSASTHWMLGTNIPYPVFFLQVIFRNWLVFMMIMLVVAAVLAWQGIEFTSSVYTVVAALVIYAVTPAWLAAILAPLCARYRDVMHAMQTIMRLMFFVTPIIWMPVPGTGLAVIAKYNVFTHFIEIIRQPLIHGVVPLDSWLVVLIVNAAGLLLGFGSYAVTRNRVAFWL